jgi:hypothetical protein
MFILFYSDRSKVLLLKSKSFIYRSFSTLIFLTDQNCSVAIQRRFSICPNCSSKNDNPPCTKKKRSSGYCGGYIEYREVKRKHKIYGQYWYHYEFWEKGRCIEKKSKYIPKSKRSRIERMNKEKIPVNNILEVLHNTNNKKMAIR